MTPNKIYSLLLAGVIGAFFLGLSFAPNDSKVLKDQWQKERKLLMEEVVRKQVRITDLIAAQKVVEEKRKADSLYFADRLERNQQAYNTLKKKYNEINLSRATHSQLDSMVSGLYPD